MVAALRSLTRPCIHQTNCNHERMTLCAFDGASTATQISYMACVDELPDATTATEANLACAASTGLDHDTIVSCYASLRGDVLLNASAATFNSWLPGRTTVPHIFVSTEDVQPTYAAISEALCAAGSAATVCLTLDLKASVRRATNALVPPLDADSVSRSTHEAQSTNSTSSTCII